MSDDVMQPVQFQLIRPDGKLLWTAIRQATRMPEPGWQFAYFAHEPERWVSVDGGLAYDQQSGWARVPDATGWQISPPWIWRYRQSGAEWVTIAQWPEDIE